MNAEQSLAVELATISGLSGKIYPIVAPQTATLPHVIYTRTGTDRAANLATGFDGLIETRYQFDVFQSTYSGLRTLMAAIITLIKGFAGTTLATTGIYAQQADIINEFETFETEVNIWHGVIECTLYYDE